MPPISIALLNGLGHVIDGERRGAHGVSASISTPVRPVVPTVASMRRPGRAVSGVSVTATLRSAEADDTAG